MTRPRPSFRPSRLGVVRCCGAGLPGLLMICAAVLCAAVLPAAAIACPDDVRPAPPLVLTQAAKARAEGRPLRILAIGSSTTVGTGASSTATNYPSQLARRLDAALGEGRVEITNAGINGESAPATLSRLELFLQAPPLPDLVLWQVGTNDVIFGGDPARLKQLVGKGLDAIAAAGAAALVIDQQYYPAILDLDRYESFVAAVGAAASERGAPLLPRYLMMKQWAAQDPAGLRATLAWDRFHPNDRGYACLADLLAPAIVAAMAVDASAPQGPAPAMPQAKAPPTKGAPAKPAVPAPAMR
ncbi:SGNH/GDSL hydrolase family protein [Xanthobacter autotrophicus]|uniref:SGNH/GDSL hydrolase family protein n=1 Tax=Xanthobacter autotrophicus TaxID=280 RepID=UPI0024A6755B|nr:SGNH/GDSL hydrolase family protein [Xanthobacter autotrophicus]MDI4657673.1 SGNH/GDSL hydrolase family protein [Xanthobacter autotrophicus]